MGVGGGIKGEAQDLTSLGGGVVVCLESKAMCCVCDQRCDIVLTCSTIRGEGGGGRFTVYFFRGTFVLFCFLPTPNHRRVRRHT